MTQKDDHFIAHEIDAQLEQFEHLAQGSAQQSPTPNARIVQKLQQIYAPQAEKERHSLERVRDRFAGHLAGNMSRSQGELPLRLHEIEPFPARHFPRMRRIGAFAQTLAAIVVVGVVVGAFLVLLNSHRGGSGAPELHPGSSGATWCVVSSPNRVGGGTILDGVAASSASDAWAVGSFVVNIQGLSQPLIEHWNGSRWSIVPSPNIGGAGVHSSLNGITAFSANDIWAVGWREVPNLPSKTLIEHWNGTRWSIVASPNPGPADNPSQLRAITVNSANDVWAVGSADSVTEETLIEHWNGIRWSIVSNPNPARAGSRFLGVTAISANDVWAVGVSFPYTRATQVSVTRTLIEHWNGIRWSIVASPSPGSTDNLLSGVTAISPSNIWAVGGSSNSRPGSTGQTLIEHWNGIRWSIVASPSPGPDSTLSGVGRVPYSSTVLAVGMFSGDTGTLFKSLTEFTCK